MQATLAGRSIGGATYRADDPDPAPGTGPDDARDRDGVAALADWLRDHADPDARLASRTVTGHELLTDSAFAFTGHSGDGGGSGAFWGRGARIPASTGARVTCRSTAR